MEYYDKANNGGAERPEAWGRQEDGRGHRWFGGARSTSSETSASRGGRRAASGGEQAGQRSGAGHQRRAHN